VRRVKLLARDLGYARQQPWKVVYATGSLRNDVIVARALPLVVARDGEKHAVGYLCVGGSLTMAIVPNRALEVY
jgi:hypothetical protein